MNSISFKDAIKLVHPDSNPNITDAGVKVRTIMKYKTNEQMLYKFISHWGLIKPTQTKFIQIYPNTKYNGMVFVGIKNIGDVPISHTTAKRVYFTEEVKKTYNRTYTSFKNVIYARKQ